jgi:hypothetical protein
VTSVYAKRAKVFSLFPLAYGAADPTHTCVRGSLFPV